MPVTRLTCPSCGARLKLSAPPTPGKTINCPRCAKPFQAPAPERAEAEHVQERQKEQSPQRSASPESGKEQFTLIPLSRPGSRSFLKRLYVPAILIAVSVGIFFSVRVFLGPPGGRGAKERETARDSSLATDRDERPQAPRREKSRRGGSAPSGGKKYAFLVACSGYTSGAFRKLPGTIQELADFRATLIDAGWPSANIVFLNDARDTERRFHCEKRKILNNLTLL